MITHSQLAIIMVLALGCGTSMVSAEEPNWVSVKQLLATPRKFDGKRVSVMGYYVDSFTDGSRLASAKPIRYLKGSRGNVWVDQTAFVNLGTVTNPASPVPGISDLRDVNNRYIRIVGIFRYRAPGTLVFSSTGDCGFGWNGFWSSEITHIVYVRTTSSNHY